MSAEEDACFSFLAENTSDVVCRAGLDKTLHYASPAVFDLLGWSPKELIGTSLNSLVSMEDQAARPTSAGATPDSALDAAPSTLRVQKKDGTFLWLEVRRRLLLDPATGEPREYIILMRDPGLREPAHVDFRRGESGSVALPLPIPGLSTYPEFLRDLEREWSRAHREGSPLSLLRLDFNGFRQFHFLDAHRVGDECLTKASAAIKSILRVTDFAAQCLAEDIVLLLPATDAENAARVAAKVKIALKGLRSPRSMEGQAWAAVSIGIATVTARAEGNPRVPELLLLAAERALQRSQQQEEETLRHIAAYSARNADWKKSIPGTPPRCA